MSKALWRVQLDADGNQVSCTRVSDGDSDDPLVHYVHASDEIEAFKAAVRRRTLITQRIRSSDRINSGKCPRCGIGDYDGTTRCKTCKQRDASISAKHRLDVAVDRFGPTLTGLPPGPPRKQHAEPMTHRQQLRLEVLREVSKKWQESSNQGLFCKWLASEILKLDPTAALERKVG